MLYFIAHLLKGKAKSYSDTLRKDISEKFDTPPLHIQVPPHITLKAPFKVDEIRPIEEVLKWFAGSELPSRFAVDGFDHFGKRVVYMHIDPSARMVEVIHEFRDALEGVSWPTFEEIEKDILALHSTLASKEIDKKFDEIWEYVNTKKEPHFELSFDHVALLKYENEKWKVVSTYPFSS